MHFVYKYSVSVCGGILRNGVICNSNDRLLCTSLRGGDYFIKSYFFLINGESTLSRPKAGYNRCVVDKHSGSRTENALNRYYPSTGSNIFFASLR